jgi:hypothetical protein
MGGLQMNISLLGIDIAKDVFQLHGADSLGKKLLKKRISRNELAYYIIKLGSGATNVQETKVLNRGFFKQQFQITPQ